MELFQGAKRNKITLRSGQLYNMIEGDVVIPSNEKVRIDGLITGDVDVEKDAILELNGMVGGTIRVSTGGKAIINGMVMKSIEELGGKVEIFGIVDGGILSQHEGNIVINSSAIVGRKSTK